MGLQLITRYEHPPVKVDPLCRKEQNISRRLSQSSLHLWYRKVHGDNLATTDWLKCGSVEAKSRGQGKLSLWSHTAVWLDVKANTTVCNIAYTQSKVWCYKQLSTRKHMTNYIFHYSKKKVLVCSANNFTSWKKIMPEQTMSFSIKLIQQVTHIFISLKNQLDTVIDS